MLSTLPGGLNPIAPNLSRAPLLFRCDANATIGTGHVTRCLALAQAWQDTGNTAFFAAAECPEALRRRLSSEGFETLPLRAVPGSSEDAESAVRQARRLHANWIVVDGDRFSPDFLQHIQHSGLKVLLVDDFASRGAFPADILLNPNFGATPEPYLQRGFHGTLLYGEKYVLLRREFLHTAAADRAFPAIGNRLLATLGGSDPDQLSAHIVSSLRDLPGLNITLIAGSANPERERLRQLSRGSVQVEFDVTDMPAFMRNADLAIVAAGGTLWELLYMRCVVLSYTRNPFQAEVVQKLADAGILLHMGHTRNFSAAALQARVQELAHSPVLRQKMADAGRKLIDGNGAQRVIETILQSSD